MKERARQAPLDYVALGESLETLGYPVRLALLDMLRIPQQLKEIRVSPHRLRKDGRPDRPVARQTIQGHLKQLIAVGLISQEIAEDGRNTTYYVSNPNRLYTISEEIRRLTLRYSGTKARTDETGTVAGVPEPEPPHGPRLVLVHGVYEGRVFLLDSSSANQGSWTVGRRRDVPVSLDYDSFVSVENAVVSRDQTGFLIRDLPQSKNGTSINWIPLERGGQVRLRPGDVIGVGRSLLVFADSQ